MLESLHLKNFLSFGPESQPVDLRKLNVLIGPNGSGKSNFPEGLALLQAAPSKLTRPIRDGGGVLDWLWKAPGVRSSGVCASLDAVFIYPGKPNLRHVIKFSESGGRFYLEDERVENENPLPGYPQGDVFFFYRFQNGQPALNVAKGGKRHLEREEVKPELSILALRRDPINYPELTFLAKEEEKIRLYREWSFGRYNVPRLPQKPDAPSDFLEEDGSNLGLVLNNLDPPAKKQVVEALRELYDGIDDYEIKIIGGNAQVFLQEQDRLIPATRLSDGTLRYLSLLAVLCHPTPPLVAIEEPELGLHPDALPTLAKLLREAGERTHLVVTTHSPILVEAFNDTPESVLVCERDDDGTSIYRLESDDLGQWLHKYSLGQLWMRGDLGGTRW